MNPPRWLTVLAVATRVQFVIVAITLPVSAQVNPRSIPVLPPINQTPSSELINERQQMVLATLSKMDVRVENIERALITLDRDRAVLDRDLFEVKWLARSVGLLILGQIVQYLYVAQKARR